MNTVIDGLTLSPHKIKVVTKPFAWHRAWMREKPDYNFLQARVATLCEVIPPLLNGVRADAMTLWEIDSEATLH